MGSNKPTHCLIQLGEGKSLNLDIVESEGSEYMVRGRSVYAYLYPEPIGFHSQVIGDRDPRSTNNTLSRLVRGLFLEIRENHPERLPYINGIYFDCRSLDIRDRSPSGEGLIRLGQSTIVIAQFCKYFEKTPENKTLLEKLEILA